MTYRLTITNLPTDNPFHYTTDVDGHFGWIRGAFCSKSGAQLETCTLGRYDDGRGKNPRGITATVIVDMEAEKAEKLARQWGFEIEAAPEAAEAMANPATPAQLDYLAVLGYTGPTLISKSQASIKIDSLKRKSQAATLTAADVDDFTGPQHTW